MIDVHRERCVWAVVIKILGYIIVNSCMYLVSSWAPFYCVFLVKSHLFIICRYYLYLLLIVKKTRSKCNAQHGFSVSIRPVLLGGVTFTLLTEICMAWESRHLAAHTPQPRRHTNSRVLGFTARPVRKTLTRLAEGLLWLLNC